MQARHCRRAHSSTAHATRLLFAIALLVSATLFPASLFAAGTGAWSPASDWSPSPSNYHAVHLALLRGDGNPDHSRVFWWLNEDGNGFHAGLRAWTPGSEGCGAFPTTFVDRPVTQPSGMNPFCAGLAQLPYPDSGLLVIGGTDADIGDYGDYRTRRFRPAGGTTNGGTWSNTGDMLDWRWYPSSSTTKDGRVLTVGGLRPRHSRYFGGRVNGAIPSAAVGEKLRRFLPARDGKWEPDLYPVDDPNPSAPPPGRPGWREGHTFIESDQSANGFEWQVLFGGRDAGGQVKNDTWFLTRRENVFSSDYLYEWQWVDATSPPLARSEHTMIVAGVPGKSPGDKLVMYGGRLQNGALDDGVYRLYWEASETKFKWAPMTISGTGPSDRCGHTAIYDEKVVGSETRKRMIVFGGTSAIGTDPIDQKVWELRFDDAQPNNATWYSMTVEDLQPGVVDPAPRYWHSMPQDYREGEAPVAELHEAYMYGGVLAGTNAYSDSLWRLNILDDGNVSWELITVTDVGGARPGPRARHSATFDGIQGSGYGRILINGGQNAGGYIPDGKTWKVDVGSGARKWEVWGDAGVALTGHTSVLDFDGTFARRAEVFDPVSQTWSNWANAPLGLTNLYPLVFSIPGATQPAGRMFVVGRNGPSYRLDFPKGGAPGSAWQALPNANNTHAPETAVMHRPGKIMVSGGTSGPTVVGTTKTLDATNLNNEWVASQDMVPRTHHNTVLLPNGKVLALGGETFVAGVETPELRPQMWDPDGNGGVGTWTAPGDLTVEPLRRGYHSTAILLPDGRVLTAGGEYGGVPPNGDGNRDKYKAEVYCPPYLFNADGTTLAARPAFQTPTGAPRLVQWRQVFTICTPNASNIQKVAMMRPGGTTHAFDENQRYVPLSSVPATNPSRLLVTAPASPDSAPPGDYLLFLVGMGSSNPEVPSVAEWIRLGDTKGDDRCDVTAGATLTNVTVEVVTPSAIFANWTATADDGTNGDSGPALEFHLRRSSVAINSEGTWTPSIESTDETSPGPIGTDGQGSFLFLQSCTWYHLAVRSDDDHRNLSGFHGEVKVKTMCGGAGGGSLVASAPEVAAPIGAEPGGVLTLATTRTAGGGWRVEIARAPSQSMSAEDAGKIAIQTLTENHWVTVRRHALAATNDEFALCRLLDGGRTVVPVGHEIARVAPSLQSAGEAFTLTHATHSAAGDITGEVLNEAPVLALAEDQTLTLDYATSASPSGDEEPWFAVAIKTAAAGNTALNNPPGSRLQLPVVPDRVALQPSRPNPASGPTAIEFTLPRAMNARLEVLDVQGRQIRTLVDSHLDAGAHSMVWDRTNRAGRRVPTGVYLCRLIAGGTRHQRAVVVIE